MNIIKVFLLVCTGVIATQAQGMLVNSLQEKSDKKQHPTLEELEKRYVSHKGVIWDPEMIYDAHDTGYIPTKVLVYDGRGNVAERTIYHGSHVKAIVLPRKIKTYTARIPSQKICEFVSQKLQQRSITHPVILMHTKGDFAGALWFSAGKIAIAIDENSPFWPCKLGHELAHCKIYHEIKRNPLFTIPERDSALQSRLMNDEYMQNYSWKENLKHLEEFYCDKMAAELLASSEDEKLYLIEQGIQSLQHTMDYHTGDRQDNIHPKPSERIKYLQLQLQKIVRDAE